jgi:hypothetical protein
VICDDDPETSVLVSDRYYRSCHSVNRVKHVQLLCKGEPEWAQTYLFSRKRRAGKGKDSSVPNRIQSHRPKGRGKLHHAIYAAGQASSGTDSPQIQWRNSKESSRLSPRSAIDTCMKGEHLQIFRRVQDAISSQSETFGIAGPKPPFTGEPRLLGHQDVVEL